jgi:DNA polymerase
VNQPALVIDYLRQLERQGVTHVPLDEDARQILRGFFRQPKRTAPEPAPTPAATVSTPSGGSRSEQLESIRTQADQWPTARNLGTLRDTMVFSAGSPEAPVAFIGEAPGFEEERRREPLVGKAGEKFDAILQAMGLSRERVYLAHLCKFRPAQRNQTTTNRKPSREEMSSCLPLLKAELGVVQPKCIVALGATAAEGLLDVTETADRLRGSWHEFEGIPLRVTYHPAYLLHSDAALPEKRKVWEDMLNVMELLELPITEKHRGYFLPK